jgi:hypothetical protein
MRLLAPAFALLCLAACGGPDPDARWLDAPTELASPAAAGSRFPHLASRRGGVLVMSWLEPAGRGEFALRFATWTRGAWSSAGTVATGRDWFVNWADFPSVVSIDDRLWAAHWLQQKPGNVYAYDVRVAMSTDAGRTWSTAVAPHDDGTSTEHGFVSLFEDGGVARVVWLDGRNTSGAHDHSSGAGGAMTLRSTSIGADAREQGPDIELDSRTCDCCQTDAARTREGSVVVYRDRSEAEVRDIALVRHTAAGWSAPVPVASDGWRIDACPVNGPAVDARGDTVVVAWFTAPDKPRVRLAFSTDGGRTFTPPIEVAAGKVAGRVDVVLLPDGRAAVSWLADRPGAAEITVQAFTAEGPAGAAAVIAHSDIARSSGFPQMVLGDGGLLFAWTRSGDRPEVRAAFARLL